MPSLSTLARSILSVQATSAASEREFSDAGNVFTLKRNSLGTAGGAQLIISS